MATSNKCIRWGKTLRIMMVLLALLLTLFVIGFLVLGQVSQTRPDNLGIHNGKLAPLAPTPNGVFSQSTTAAQFIEPLHYSKSPEEAQACLKEILRRQPRAALIDEAGRYLHVEFRSRLFGFVDDVEFLVEDRVIQVRSASRVGRSDLGINRQRIESLRLLFNELQP